MKIAIVQFVNLVLLYITSSMALEAWWKVCLFGIGVMIVTTTLAIRFKESSTALTIGTLPIAWIVGLGVLLVGKAMGLNIG